MKNTYLEIPLDGVILYTALKRAESLPVLKNSHRKLQANIVGCIGEVVFERFMEEHDIPCEDQRGSTEHDYVIGDGITVDVKTKDRTVRPRSFYDNSVPLYNHAHQRPDYYYFVSLLRDKSIGTNDINRFKTAFLVGGIDIKTLDREGTHWDAGETDRSNGTTFWTACINVNMDQLTPNEDMVDLFKNQEYSHG